ncbi:MAG: hypothetical protein LBQ61_05330 [Spirochaetales bacterium]|jgi:hypothetical protein|nr:hypothetical protein [Spirochaetales bacterium]
MGKILGRNALYLLLLFSLSPLFAQERTEGSPFAIRLMALPVEGGIRLTWQNYENRASGFVLYRHTGVIGEENLDQAEVLARLPGEAASYLDTPPEGIPFFYAVLALDEADRVQPLFIPLANLTLEGTLPGPREYREPAREIQAEVVNDAVRLRFQSGARQGNWFIYRSTSPITDPRSLLTAVLADTIPAHRREYRDRPLWGVEYYYAVLNEEALRGGELALRSGENATALPVILPPPAGSGETLPESFSFRPLPLPQLQDARLFSQGAGYSALLDKAPEVLRPEVTRAVADLLGGLSEAALPAPGAVILPADQDPRTADPSLDRILKEYFMEGNYAAALELLQNYRLLHLPREIVPRIHFYAGQAEYFLGSYKNALLEFLFAEETYHAECRPYISALIRLAQ